MNCEFQQEMLMIIIVGLPSSDGYMRLMDWKPLDSYCQAK